MMLLLCQAPLKLDMPSLYLLLVKQRNAVFIRQQLLAMQYCWINIMLHGPRLHKLGLRYVHFVSVSICFQCFDTVCL